jgi:hypothetical protein
MIVGLHVRGYGGAERGPENESPFMFFTGGNEMALSRDVLVFKPLF